MNDFLSNLASKSLSLAPLIQPRPLSLFEPWPAGGTLEAAHHNVDMPLQPAPAMGSLESERSPLRLESDATVQTWFDPPRREPHDPVDKMQRAPFVQPTPSLETMPPPPAMTPGMALMSAPVVSQPGERKHEASNEAAVLPPPDRSVRVQSEEARATTNGTPIIERIERVIVERSLSDHDRWERENQAPSIGPRHAAERVEQIATSLQPAPKIELQLTAERPPAEHVIVEHENIDRDNPGRPDVTPTITEMAAPSAPHPLVTPIVERVERVREKPDGGDDARSGLMRTTQPPLTASRSAPESQLSVPPTIHVTIGRIEVRATPPPTPVKRTAPTVTTMSLDEYLRSRSGDRR